MSDSEPDVLDYLTDTRRLELVGAIGRGAASADPSLERVVREIAHELDAVDVHLSLVGASASEVIASWGVEPAQIGPSGCVCRRVVAKKHLLIVEDTHSDPRVEQLSEAPMAHAPGFYVGLPILVDGHAVGTLCVRDEEPRRLEVGARAALFGWLQQLEAQLAFHVRHVSATEHTVDAAVEPEREARRKDLLLAHMLHGAINLASSAHSDALYMRTLVKDRLENSDASEALDDIHMSLTTVCDTLHSARSLAKSRIGKVESGASVSMCKLVEDVVNLIEVGGVGSDSGVAIHTEGGLDWTRVDPKLMMDCLIQLIHLSMEASGKASDLRIRISGDEGSVRAELNFDGEIDELRAGVPESAIELVDTYDSLRPTTEQTLEFCTMVAEAHDGELNVFRYEKSSSLVLELPAA